MPHPFKKSHETFIEELFTKHSDFDIIVLDTYQNAITKLLVKMKYGNCYSLPTHLLEGKMPTIQSAVDKNEYFTNQAREIHGDKYDYSLVDYIKNSEPIKIYCKTHKKPFLQKPCNHLHGESGCPDCGIESRSVKKVIPFIDLQAEFYKKYPESSLKLLDRTNDGKLIIQNEFGICECVFSNLMKGHLPSIVTAIDKNSYFINQANKRHNFKYVYIDVNYVDIKSIITFNCPIHGLNTQVANDHLHNTGCYKCSVNKRNINQTRTHEEFLNDFNIKNPNSNIKILGNYINNNTSILVKVKYGNCMSKPSHLLNGKTPSIQSAVDKNDYFKNEANEKHNFKFTYENVVYIKNNQSVWITCPIHGDFPQTPAAHLSGHGCRYCQADNSTKSLETFIKEANIVHDNFYTYDNAIYITNNDPLFVTCPIHKDYPVRPRQHLAGQKCMKCSLQYNVFSYRQWEQKGLNSNNFVAFQLYIIKCWDDNEEFYKIGKTFVEIKSRFKTKKNMPYNYEISHLITSDAIYISYLEHYLHNYCKEYHYTPKIKFKGSYAECFKIDDINEIIEIANTYKIP